MIKLPYSYKGVPIGSPKNRKDFAIKNQPKGKTWKTVLAIIIILAVLGYAVYYLLADNSKVVAEQENTAAESGEAVAVPAPAAPAPKPVQKTPVAISGTKQPAAVKPAAKKVPTVSVVRDQKTTLTQAQSVFCSGIEKRMLAGQHSEARKELAAALKNLDVNDALYPHAQQYLAMCAEVLRSKGAFKSSSTEHMVQPGENLSGIAQKYKVSTAAIQRASNLKNPNRLSAGQMLTVPVNTWKVLISVGKQKLFVYQQGELVRIYSLNISKLPNLPTTGKFQVRSENQEWKIYGLGISDIRSLRNFVPVGTTVEISK